MTNRHDTHAVRRTKYGLNVAVALIAALLLATLVNWIAYRQTDARWDFTATRAHSLAPQTRQVLDGLDSEFRIVTMFREDLDELTRIRDLASEYGRRSGNVRIEHINPDVDVRRRQQLHADVREHFADELEPFVATVNDGVSALRAITERMPTIGTQLGEALEDESFEQGTTRQRVQQINAVITGQQSALSQQMQGVDEALDQSLPDYVAIKEAVQQLIEELDDGLLRTGVAWFEEAVESPSVPNRVKNALLSAKRELETLREASRSALREMRLAERPRRYDEARQGLSVQQTVVVFGPGKLRVIPAREMYRETAEGQQADMAFLGEERLTGALIAMGLEQPPMVVFVNSGRQPAIGEQGMYQQVAERLASANVRVEQWSPGGRMSSTGQPLPASSPPRAESGQRTVWIVLPVQDDNPMTGGASKEAVAELLEQRLAAGDAAMVMLMLDPAAGTGVYSPIVELLRDDWGIRPQLDRQVLREVQTGGGQTQSTGQFEVDRWPSELPVSQALAGMRGMFVQASPVHVGAVEGVQQWPIAALQGQRMWAARRVTDPEALRSARYDAAESEPSFPIAVAAERGDARLIAVADPVWASDVVTTYGQFGRGTAEISGALFPANSEMFVNSVYWLAGMEGLIAASPRTQDIRRIRAMSDMTLRGYYIALLGGAPLLILGAGVGVWFVRRRG
ncbi:Gldg family protein [Phycisphaerales bacterium AB-hyl4]|uniref:Gldg family protein n=1 Tax=Natronomicrosphaera hydrolytica TaxID=3242702 RepID=A0ABV4UBE4_9BACT